MSEFITLTGLNGGAEIRVNRHHVVTYHAHPSGTGALVRIPGGDFTVAESVEDVDRLLGHAE